MFKIALPIVTFHAASFTPLPMADCKKSLPPDQTQNSADRRLVDAGMAAICDNKFEVVLPETARLFEASNGIPSIAERYSIHKCPLEYRPS